MDLLVSIGAVAAVMLVPALVMWAHTVPRRTAQD